MATPKKSPHSRRKMTAPLKAELGQVNFYSMKKSAEKKAAAKKAAGSEGPKKRKPKPKVTSSARKSR